MINLPNLITLVAKVASNMRYLINHIADLHSGIYVNTSSFRGGSVYYLQVRHWNKERNWQAYVAPELHNEKRLHKSFLVPGDVLLATKGVDHFAATYDGLYTPAVASSVFTVLRIKDPQLILSEYLQWFLNHPSTTQKLVSESKGTSTPHISRDVIGQLTLPVPTIENQEKILEAHKLQLRAIRLRTRINHLSEVIYNTNLLKIAYK